MHISLKRIVFSLKKKEGDYSHMMKKYLRLTKTKTYDDGDDDDDNNNS
jgi:hypothetical protein